MGSARAAEVLISRGASGFTLVVAAGLEKIDQVRATIESGQTCPGIFGLCARVARVPRLGRDAGGGLLSAG